MKIILIILLAFVGYDEPAKAKATHNDYKNAILIYKNFNDSTFSQQYWNKIEIIDKKTNDVKSFSILKPIEKHTFILVFSQQIGQESEKLQSAWKQEIKKFSEKDYESDNPSIAKKEDVVKYSKELLEIRIGFSKKYDSFARKMLMDFKDEITDDEKKIIYKKLDDLKKIVASENKD